jgi:hypothetical protein
MRIYSSKTGLQQIQNRSKMISKVGVKQEYTYSRKPALFIESKSKAGVKQENKATSTSTCSDACE